VGATVTIPANAAPAGTVITVTEFAATDPALPPNSLSRVIQFGPAGQTFTADVSIVFSYTDAEVAGKDETSLQVNLLVAGTYVTVGNCTSTNPPLPVDPCVSARNTAANTITVVTRHFSIYALAAPPSTPTPTPAPGGQTCDGRPATIVGTNGNNFIVGTRHADVIVALGGHDLVFGMGGDDVICLGDGKDLAFGGKGNDRIFGQGGKDHLFGEKGNDYLDGGADKDDCFGGSGSNTLVNCEKGKRNDDHDDDGWYH
jgi:hypothetical protein